MSRKPRFRIRIWGARGTCPSPGADKDIYGGNTNCVEVRSDSGDVIVLDAGTGIRALGLELERDKHRNSVHLFLSHQHADHVLGLPHFAPLLNGAQPVRVYCGNANADQLRPYLRSLLSPPFFPLVRGQIERLDIREWTLAEGAGIDGAIRVHRLRAQHPDGAAIARIDDEYGAAIAYAPDNELEYSSSNGDVKEWRESLVASLRGIPLLLHDSTYVDDELPARVGWGHSSAEESTRFAVECEAKKLLLFHHHPDRRDVEVAEILERCRAIAAESGSNLEVEAAREGMEIEV